GLGGVGVGPQLRGLAVELGVAAAARSGRVSWTSAMSAGEVREASQYVTPVGMKKTWKAASPTAKFHGAGIARSKAPNTWPVSDVPALRPNPLTRFPRLNTVPRCSGGLTSAMRAYQLGEFAEVRASATSAARKLSAITGSVTTLASTPVTTAPAPAPSATSRRIGTKNSTT